MDLCGVPVPVYNPIRPLYHTKQLNHIKINIVALVVGCQVWTVWTVAFKFKPLLNLLNYRYRGIALYSRQIN